jgi:DNA invertase Pin-like site-specific DNA recombinase
LRRSSTGLRATTRAWIVAEVRTAMCKFILAQMDAFADLEAALTGKRTRAALAAAKHRALRAQLPEHSSARQPTARGSVWTPEQVTAVPHPASLNA